VMERFFARHVSLNSFVETRLRSASRGEIMCWRPQCGARAIL
jgi:type VI secretion system protein ImpG